LISSQKKKQRRLSTEQAHDHLHRQHKSLDLALLSDTGAVHSYISKAGWLELRQHIATINSDGVLTAPVDFMAVQLALYGGLAMTTKMATVRRTEKNRKALETIPVAAE
jgi:hypothetical protein